MQVLPEKYLETMGKTDKWLTRATAKLPGSVFNSAKDGKVFAFSLQVKYGTEKG